MSRCKPGSWLAPPRQKNKKPRVAGLCFLAEWTGLEPATPGVTGRYSNQLNYHSNAAPTRRCILGELNLKIFDGGC
jgi:hypothetical protein